jgi:predicted DNA-binding transcriptional regulator YafY
VVNTSSRILRLLALLQSRPDWPGSELAERLDVSPRTIRNDIDRLRELGYPVDAVRGPAGHYRLGVGAKLPPLLLDDEEAVAVAIGLRAGRGVAGIEESSTRALSKLEQVLPHRLRRQVSAIHAAMSEAPANTGTNVDAPTVDAAVLSRLAATVRDHELLRFDYTVPDRGDGPGRYDGSGVPAPDDRPLTAEPYRLVSWVGYWFLVARVPATAEWHAYRVDWMELRMATGRRFAPVALPASSPAGQEPPPVPDYTSFVLRDVAAAGWKVHARITVAAPAAEVLGRINPTVGVVESIDDSTCVLVTGAESLEIIAVYIGMLGLDSRVTGPPALVDHLRTVGERYLRAISG